MGGSDPSLTWTPSGCQGEMAGILDTELVIGGVLRACHEGRIREQRGLPGNYFMQKSCEFLALEIFYTPPRSHFSTVTLLLLKPYIGQFS